MRGQGMVEFAILLPLMVMLVIGGIEIGRLYHAVITLTNAAREGARYAVLNTQLQNGMSTEEATEIKTAASSEAQSAGISLYPADVIPSCPSPLGCLPALPVRVEVSYKFDFLLQSFFPTDLIIRRQIEMVIP